MKKEFWVHEMSILFYWPLMITISSILIIVGIIMTIKFTFCWPILISGIFILILCLYAIFIKKEPLSKVEFSEDSIILKRFNKKIEIINWSDITEVKTISYSPFARNANYLSFVSGNKHIEIVLTKKKYQTIMILCPNQNIKNQINNIDSFKWFHKDKK